MEARNVTLLVDLGVTKEFQGRLESCAKPRKAKIQGASGLRYLPYLPYLLYFTLRIKKYITELRSLSLQLFQLGGDDVEKSLPSNTGIFNTSFCVRAFNATLT